MAASVTKAMSDRRQSPASKQFEELATCVAKKVLEKMGHTVIPRKQQKKDNEIYTNLFQKKFNVKEGIKQIYLNQWNTVNKYKPMDVKSKTDYINQILKNELNWEETINQFDVEKHCIYEKDGFFQCQTDTVFYLQQGNVYVDFAKLGDLDSKCVSHWVLPNHVSSTAAEYFDCFNTDTECQSTIESEFKTQSERTKIVSKRGNICDDADAPVATHYALFEASLIEHNSLIKGVFFYFVCMAREHIRQKNINVRK